MYGGQTSKNFQQTESKNSDLLEMTPRDPDSARGQNIDDVHMESEKKYLENTDKMPPALGVNQDDLVQEESLSYNKPVRLREEYKTEQKDKAVKQRLIE